MNSLILSFIYSFWGKFTACLAESKLWQWLGRIHQTFCTAFAESSIVKAVKYRGKISLEETSLACRLLRIPTAVLSSLCKFFSGFVKNVADNTLISKYVQGFISGALSLNTRFISLLVLFSSVSSFCVKLLKGNFSFLAIIIAIVCFGISFLDGICLSDYIDESICVKMLKSLFGFDDVSFRVYKKVSSAYVYTSAALVGAITGVAGAVLPLMYAIPVALAAIGVVIINPVCGIFFAVFAAPLVPTLVLVGICVLTAICTLGHKAYPGEYGIKMGRAGLCLMLFLVISALSTVFSASLKGSVGVLGMYIIFIGFYYIIRDQLRKEKTISGLLKVFAISAAIVSVYGILQYVFKWDTQNAWIDTEMFEEATMRAYSTLANPNVLGEYLILALPIIALVIVNYTKTILQKVVYCGIFAVTFLCLILTQSRGCWIGFMVSALVFVTYYKSAMWKVIPFGLLLLPFIIPETMINRFLSVGDMSDSSTSYRVYIWFGTLIMLKDYWMGGIGLGEAAFRSIYPEYAYHGIVAPHSHNLYLQLIVESGIISLVVFVVAMLIFFKDMLNMQLRNRHFGTAAAALMSGVAGFLVQSMFDYTFYNYRVMAIFFMVMAIGGSFVTVSSKDSIENK